MNREDLLKAIEEADERIRIAIQYNRGIGIDAGTPYAKAIAEADRLVREAMRQLQAALEPPDKRG